MKINTTKVKTKEQAAQQHVDQQIAAQVQQKLKDSSATPAGVAPHGYNAAFNNPGVNPGVIAAIVRPNGLEDWLEQNGHVRLSNELNPVFAVMTGQGASTGTEPTTPCDENVPTVGSFGICHQTYPFGELTRKSKSIRVDNAGEVINRSEPLDMRLLNNPFGDLTMPVPVSAADLFRSKLAKEAVELAFALRRDFARLIHTGNPANTASSTGGYIEPNGLDRLINTGYRDVFTGAACSAADSLVRSRSAAIVQNTATATVKEFVEVYRDRKQLAEDVGLGDVQFAWLMRRQLFLALTEVWPCVFNTARCAEFVASPVNVNVDGPTSVQMRDQMRKGSFLLIDGEEVPVIIDNTLAELNVGGGNFQSGARLIPYRAASLSDTGGQAIYVDYFNYRAPNGAAEVIRGLNADAEYRVSNDGRFIYHFMGGLSFCKQITIRTRKRYILRLPFLAARIDDIRYNVYIHEREWQPGTSFYEAGGRTSFAGTSFQSPV